MPPLTMALPPIDTATMALYGTIQSGVPCELCRNSGHAQHSWDRRCYAYTCTVQYGAILPQHIVSAPEQFQAPPTEPPMATMGPRLVQRAWPLRPLTVRTAGSQTGFVYLCTHFEHSGHNFSVCINA